MSMSDLREHSTAAQEQGLLAGSRHRQRHCAHNTAPTSHEAMRAQSSHSDRLFPQWQSQMPPGWQAGEVLSDAMGTRVSALLPGDTETATVQVSEAGAELSESTGFPRPAPSGTISGRSDMPGVPPGGAARSLPVRLRSTNPPRPLKEQRQRSKEFYPRRKRWFLSQRLLKAHKRKHFSLSPRNREITVKTIT